MTISPLVRMTLCAALVAGAASAADIAKRAPALMTLDQLVASKFEGGWITESVNEQGAGSRQSLILHADGRYKNFITSEILGAPPISAMGQGFWFARIAADGAIEIALTTDPKERDPAWVLRALAIGTLLDSDKVWHR